MWQREIIAPYAPLDCLDESIIHGTKHKAFLHCASVLTETEVQIRSTGIVSEIVIARVCQSRKLFKPKKNLTKREREGGC